MQKISSSMQDQQDKPDQQQQQQQQQSLAIVNCLTKLKPTYEDASVPHSTRFF